MGGVAVVKVRHKEQTRELLAMGGCLSGLVAVMCPTLRRSVMFPLCTTASFVMEKKKRTYTGSNTKRRNKQ